MREYSKLIPAQESLQEGEWLLAKDIATGGIKRYYIYDSIDQFLREQERHRKHYYEVLNGQVRLYMDLDIPKSATTEREVVDFLDTLKDRIHEHYPRTTINIYTSASEKNYSYHIVLPDVVLHSVPRVQNEVKKIIQDIQSPLKQYVDLKVYKSNQLFRMLGSSKIDGGIKVVYEGPASQPIQDSLVQPIYLTVDLDKTNAINIVSRLQYVDDYLHNLMDKLGLHPDWFSYYLNSNFEKPVTLTSNTFWKQLLSAAVKVQNYSLLESILHKELPTMTKDEKDRIKSYLEKSRVPRTYIDLIPSD